MTKTYYHYCVDVFFFDTETEEYKLWFKESFSSKQNFEIWADGFAHGTNKAEYPARVKLGKPYVKYRDYKPQY